jgi:hypothetical protein
MNRRDVFKLTALTPAVAAAQTAAPSAISLAWKPEALDAHQNDTVVALSDLIIPDTDTPGAKAANVNRYIDLLLRDGSEETKRAFVAGLGSLDGLSIRKFGSPFVRCSKSQQTEVLTEMDASNHEFFRMAKRMIAQIYYNTAIGYRELNKGGRVPRTFGCQA